MCPNIIFMFLSKNRWFLLTKNNVTKNPNECHLSEIKRLNNRLHFAAYNLSSIRQQTQQCFNLNAFEAWTFIKEQHSDLELF